MKSPSMRCFGDHLIKKVSHKRKTEVRLWTQSSDMDMKGNQDAIPSNVYYLGNDVRSAYNTCTSNAHGKLRYRGFETMHVGVELLNDHGGTTHRYLT